MSRPKHPEPVLRKNQIITLHITGMTAEGNGVGHFCGLAVFVPMTAVGDTAEVRIVKVLKSYAFGIIESLTEPAAGRVQPECPVFRQCGGCVFQHVDAQTELQYKEQLVRDAFERIGRLHPAFEPICGCESRAGYRNKAQYPVAEQDGHLVCGFYAKHSHRVIPYTGCLLHPPVFTKLLETLLPLLEQCGVSAYHEETNSGMLRHVYLRRGYHSGEIMLCLVTRVSIRKKIAGVLPELLAAFPEIKSITESVNPDRTNVILGRTVTVLAGAPDISDTMCGKEIRISPQSFYQINTAQAERLYGIAKDYAGLHGTETLLDCELQYKAYDVHHQLLRRIGQPDDCTAQRRAICERIAELMRQSKEDYIRRCRGCGKELPIGSISNYCEECFSILKEFDHRPFR